MPRTIRSHRILSGPLRGLRIVTSWHDYPAAILGRTERPLLEWFKANVCQGETWLDIGAHYGYTSIALCQLVGSEGRVVAFEPHLGTVGQLAQMRRLNNLWQMKILPFALSDGKSMEFSQLPTSRGMVDPSLINRDWNESIMLARFDWLWPHIANGDESFHGVKIDVQGMEIHVLRGMVEVLKFQQPKLVVELHSGVERGELLSLLESVGYARKAIPIEPTPRETETVLADDRSYAFQPA